MRLKNCQSQWFNYELTAMSLKKIKWNKKAVVELSTSQSNEKQNQATKSVYPKILAQTSSRQPTLIEMQAEINQLRAHISDESIRRIERSLDVALSHVEIVWKEKDTELAHCKVIIDTANANLIALQQKYDEEVKKNKATEEGWSKKYSADLGALQQKCNEEIEKHAATEERWIMKYNAHLGVL